MAGIRRAADQVAKRGFDILFSGLILVAAAPFFFVIAIAIKAESAGPVFYRGPRVGRNRRPFYMLKFRTMVTEADKKGGSSTPDNDPRITRVGRVLRAKKLDELPQLWNVFKGEMSVVGPRPQVEWAVARYEEHEQAILSVLPGITDQASLAFPNEGEILRGSSDPDRDYFIKIHPEKMRLSLEYIRQRTFFGDLRIIGQTVATLLKRNRA
jgi:lipopolysaccharide/colanic/teichoic acid biosynthesis glycosyltransferase